MSKELAKRSAAYVARSNAHDADTCAACFTDDAVVLDEGRARQGQADIREWLEESIKQYRPPVELRDVFALAGFRSEGPAGPKRSPSWSPSSSQTGQPRFTEANT